jgi:hypothetical protein
MLDVMDDLLTLAWRPYPAAVLMLVGAALVGAGVHAAVTGDWRHGGPVTALAYLVSFRRAIVGLAVAGLGLGWVEQLPWLFWASLCIGLGELLESSYYIVLVRSIQRRYP